jgi:glycosyltransferase involved in cell wall biosynthesis
MPRLLILCEYPTLLGGERSMLATMPVVMSSGFEVNIAGPPNGQLADELRRLAIGHLPWGMRDSKGLRFPLRQLRADLCGLMRTTLPDLVHANSLSTARIAGPAAAELGVRSIGHLRDIVKLTPQAVADLNSHCRLIAVSQATKDCHVAQGLAATKCVVVHNGVDLVKFSPRTPTRYLHRELGLLPNARLAAVVGQLGLRKGTDVALQAALQLASAFSELHWLIVGERTSNKEEAQAFEARLHKLAAEPPLADRVHFLGNRTDVPKLLAECDLLVHAARQEPLSRVLLEGAATGLPVVATDVGGTGEIFPDESNATVLVPADDVHALTQAIRGILVDESYRKALGAAARRRAESAFDIRTAAARLIEQYQLVLS